MIPKEIVPKEITELPVKMLSKIGQAAMRGEVYLPGMEKPISFEQQGIDSSGAGKDTRESPAAQHGQTLDKWFGK